MIQRNQRTLTPLTRPLLTKRTLIRRPNQIRPIPINHPRPRIQQRIRHILQKRGYRIERRAENEGFELETFTAEVGVDEGEDGAFGGRAIGVCGVDGGEGVKDGLGRVESGFVDECFGVCVELGEVDGL